MSETCACTEAAGVRRRNVLAAGLAASGLAVAGALGDVRVALGAPRAAGDPARDVLVVVSLRGGFDGLSAVPPLGDPGYRAARPTIAVPTSTALWLDSRFGLHPAMAPLLPFWRSGQLAVVQDVGQDDPTRSHFEAMRSLERAAPGSALRTGWLDRVLGAIPGSSPFQGAQVGTAKATDALRGPAPELALHRIDEFTLWGTDAESLPRVQKLYRALYASAPDVVRAPALVAMDALTTAARLKADGYTPSHGVTYPKTGVAQSLRDVARLVRADVGLQVAVVDVGDWDLHANMGTADSGGMRDRLAALADALAAFATDLGPLLDGVTLVTLSEFGRRVAENGSGGTDHGHGNCVLLLGGGVVGGRVHGTWPGLAPDVLVQGDLPGRLDYRAILADVVRGRMGLDPAAVFPGLTGDPLGVVRARPSTA